MIDAHPSRTLPTLVFDLDGTLADTASDLIATLNVLMARMGVAEVPVDRARDVVGAGARAMIRRGLALGAHSATEAQIDALFDDFLVHYAENIAVRTALYPGARAALERLALAGYRLAVCTNKPEALARRLLDALGVAGRFGSICGGDSFAFAKPDPRHLTGTVSMAGGDRGHAIMIGDSRTDVDTARAAGLPIIAVSFGYADRPVPQLGADRVIDHFDELDAAVAALRPAG